MIRGKSKIKTLHFRKKYNGVPILSKKEIDNYAEELIQDYKPELLCFPQVIPVDKFAEFYLDIEFDYQNLSYDGSILGMIAFNDGCINVLSNSYKEVRIETYAGTVFIDNSLLYRGQENRYRYTVGHEAGHWIFHKQRYETQDNQYDFGFDPMDYPVACSYRCLAKNIGRISQFSNFSTDEDWQEWQADYFSSALLMPKSTFSSQADYLFRRQNVRPGDPINMLLFKIIPMIEELAEKFAVSKEAAKVRLYKLGYIDKKTMSAD
jgi:Zn-dependent peptidase ImmA (M78 family)